MGKIQSLYLTAQPSFLEGMARLFDFAGTLSVYNESRSPDEADIRALRADWQALGDDMRFAIDKTMTTPKGGSVGKK
jgi:hypothetical protein